MNRSVNLEKLTERQEPVVFHLEAEARHASSGTLTDGPGKKSKPGDDPGPDQVQPSTPIVFGPLVLHTRRYLN